MRIVGGIANSNRSIATALVMFSCLIAVASGWCLPKATTSKILARSQQQPAFQPSSLRLSATTDDNSVLGSTNSVEDVSRMRLSEIKSELNDRKIDFSDCFDKESMVLKLAEARANNVDNSDNDSPSEDSESESGNDTTESSEEASPSDFDRESALAELQGMRVRELREELGRRRISRAGLFEKEDLVRALLEARAVASVFSGTGLLTPGEVSELKASDVKAEIDHAGGSPLLLDVYATWCGPCQMIAPILKEIAAEQGDKLRVVKMDSDQNQALSSELRVNGLPTLVLFQNGNEVDRIEGAPTKEQLVGWIESRR